MNNGRLAWGCFCFLASLLCVFKAPVRPLWYLALGVTEWGHFLALLSLVPLFPLGQPSSASRVGALLGVIAFGLALTPLYRARQVARSLPDQLIAAFGDTPPLSGPEAPARPAPLVRYDLWGGVYTPAVRQTTPRYSTVDGQPLAMDLYQPQKIDRPMPAVVVIHGGSWQSGEKNDLRDLNRYLAARGYLVAAIDYRLAPRWHFPAQRQDVTAAIAYLKEHAQALGFDGKNLVLLGRSAGGQIALTTAYTAHDPTIRGVIAFYSPADLNLAYRFPSSPLIMNSRKILEDYLGGPPARVPGLYNAASPINAVDAVAPPTLLIHGGRDELVWPVHDERLSIRLKQARRPYFFLCLPWATHGFDYLFSGPGGQISTYAVERFLAAVTR